MIPDTQQYKKEDQPPPGPDMQQASEQLAAIGRQIDLSHAIEVAQLGDLNLAEAILRENLRELPSHKAWDTLARICAQRGELEKARSCWEEALKLEKECQECQAGIDRIQKIQKSAARSYGWPVILRRLFFSTAILLIIITGFILTQNSIGNLYALSYQTLEEVEKNQPGSGDVTSLFETQQVLLGSVDKSLEIIANTPQANASSTDNGIPIIENQEQILQHLENSQMDLDQMIESVESIQLTQTASTLQSTPIPDPVLVQHEAVTVAISEKGEREIIFRQGLFRYETLLSSSGQEVLREIAYQLEPFVGKTNIRVIGFTDDLEKGNGYLALKRAVEVVAFFDAYTQLPKTMFIIEDPGVRPAPYPNDSWENRANNRTVILVISPNEE